MKDVLERLGKARGVRASAVFDDEGICLAAEGAPEIMNSLMRMGEAFVEALSEHTAAFASRTNSAILRYEGGSIVIRRMPRALLVIIGEPNIDMTVGGAGFAVNLSMNVLRMQVRSVRPSGPPGASSTSSIPPKK